MNNWMNYQLFQWTTNCSFNEQHVLSKSNHWSLKEQVAHCSFTWTLIVSHCLIWCLAITDCDLSQVTTYSYSAGCTVANRQVTSRCALTTTNTAKDPGIQWSQSHTMLPYLTHSLVTKSVTIVNTLCCLQCLVIGEIMCEAVSMLVGAHPWPR